VRVFCYRAILESACCVCLDAECHWLRSGFWVYHCNCFKCVGDFAEWYERVLGFIDHSSKIPFWCGNKHRKSKVSSENAHSNFRLEWGTIAIDWLITIHPRSWSFIYQMASCEGGSEKNMSWSRDPRMVVVGSSLPLERSWKLTLDFCLVGESSVLAPRFSWVWSAPHFPESRWRFVNQCFCREYMLDEFGKDFWIWILIVADWSPCHIEDIRCFSDSISIFDRRSIQSHVFSDLS
jgi:hypothetical protein